MEPPAQGDLAAADPPTGEALIALANADPLAVVHATAEAAARASTATPPDEQTCLRLRARSMAQRALGDYDAALVSIELAKQEARALDNKVLEAQCLLTHAPLPAFAGRVANAHKLLDAADRLAPGRFDAEIAFQRAGIAVLVADWRGAGEIYTDAITQFEHEGDDLGIADACMTRGLMSAYVGDMADADADFDRARELFARLDDAAGAGLVQWNRALSLLVNGEAAAAVIEFEAANALFATTTYPNDELLGDLSEAYFSVGLEQEAVDAAADCVASFYPNADRSDVLAGRDLGPARNPLDAASRTLELARALAMTGAFDAARVHGEYARAQFHEHGQQLRVRRADAVLLTVRLEEAGRLSSGADHAELARICDEAHELATSWQTSVDIESRGEAELISLRASVAAGNDERSLATIARLGAMQLSFRYELERAEHVAALAIAHGDVMGAAQTVATAVDAVRERQLLTGSSFVAAAQSRRLERLLAITLPPLLRDGNAQRALELIERADLSPISRRADGATTSHQGALHAEYRSITAAIAEARARQQNPTTLTKRLSQLEARIRQEASSISSNAGDRLQVATEPIHRYVGAQGRLWLLQGADGDLSTRELGSVEPIADLIDKLNRQIRVQFERPDGARHTRIVAMAKALDDMLAEPGQRAGETVHIVASPALPSLPWGLLPSVGDRRWARSTRATQRSAPEPITNPRVALIGGAELAFAASEITEIAAVHHDTKAITGAAATAEAVLEVLASCDIAHIASHASLNRGNPMFSSLTMADGELSLYELEALPSTPPVLVIASCRSADELRVGTAGVGIATALLQSGAELVIGAAVELPDSAAMTTVMVELHRQLRVDPYDAVGKTVQRFEPTSPEWLIASCLTPCVREPLPTKAG